MGLIYILCATLDTFFYGLAAILFNIIMKIAYIEILEDDFISDLTSKIYLIVGVLILFRVAISAIQYLINPDTFDDKEKGMVGLIKNLLITVILIAIVPSVFKFAISIQKPILQSIPAIILGNKASDYGIKNNGGSVTLDANAGEKISFMVLSGFVQARSGKGGSICANGCNIHDLTSFNSEILRGSMIEGLHIDRYLIGPDWNTYQYDYVIIFSTLTGGFLCYILLSMSLDIGIRAFKLAIIQMLAPIPISSYAFDKEKFKKFAKTSLQVYVDLFIRMVIIFLIVFLIQRILLNVDVRVGSNVKINTGGSGILGWLSWFEDFFVRVILVYGLLLFARNAPKFITDLLGLPEVTGGDMMDMFKAPWQRVGGATAALANPWVNAVSNARKAWKNNEDMGNRFRDRIRRGLNAARHAAGGFGRGSMDSLQGIMTGDDWAKMNQRRRESVRRSGMRSAADFMRRTSRNNASETNEKVRARRAELEQEFADQGININDLMNSGAIRAKLNLRKSNLEAKIRGLQADMQAIGANLTSADATIRAQARADMASKSKELADSEAELAKLNTKEGADEFLRAEAINAAAHEKVVKAANDKANKERRVQTLMSEIQSLSPNSDEYKKKVSEIAQLNGEIEQLSKVNEADAKKEFGARMEEFVKLKRDKYDANDQLIEQRPTITRGTIFAGRVDEFFGGEGFTGKGYIDTANLLKDNRASLWSGEAMAKLKQAPTILSVNGVEPTFSPNKLTLGHPLNREVSYSEIYDLYSKVESGVPLTPAEDALRINIGFKNTSEIRAAFTDIEKQAASVYVTMANNGQINNSTISEGIRRLIASIAGSNIPQAEKNKLIDAIMKDPGQALKDASDVQERLRTLGSEISAYNSGNRDGQ